jgi:hypothetical protein
MKSQTLIGLAAVTMVSLSACSQAKKPTQNSSAPSRTYNVDAQKVTATHVVFRKQTYQPNTAHPQNSASQQTSIFQQVREPQVRQAGQNPAQANNSELYAIGDQIFKNETGGKIDQLVHWNHREDFASMGIGHFTWYPAGRRARYGNTFPGLLDYLQKNGVQLPYWVQRARFEGAPWRSREELMRAKNTPEVRQFAQLLHRTRHLQAKYIMDRAMRAMPRLVKKTPQHLRGHVANNLNAVANSRGGRYVLIDYVNFKGEGLNRSGGYKGHNWGLLQVLEEMRPSNVGPQALNEFANASMRVLERRVRNSNPSRNERKWLPGWRNRTNTYRNPV